MASRIKSCENLRELEPKQLAFVEAYSSPPYPSIAKAAEATGYNPSYAYQLVQLPHVKAAIAKRTQEIREANDGIHARLIAKWGQSALAGDGRDAREDGKLFLQALNVGMGGVRIVNNVTANATQAEALEDRIKRIVKVPQDS